MPTPPVYVLTVNGIVVPMLLGFSINEVANGRNRLTCDILALDGTPRAPLGAPIKLTEDGTTIFGGSIDAPMEAGVGGLPLTKTRTRVSAIDNNALAERRVLNVTFPAGTIKSWLTTLIGYLAPFGTTLDPAQVNGPTLPAISCLFIRVDDALNQFSDLTASTATPMVWEIDYNNVLRMKAAAVTPAPFDIVDGDRHAIGDVTVEPSQEDYANRVLLLAGDGLHDVQDTFTGDGSTSTFPLGYPISATRGYVTNGITNETIANADTGGVWWSIDVSVTPNTITRHPSPPAAASAISINYTAQFPVLKFADAGGVAAPLPDIWEKVIREPDVFDNATAQQLANSYVAQTSRRPRTVHYLTHQRGIHPGMTQHIKVTPRHVDTTFLITDVTIQNRSGTIGERLVTAVEGTTFLGSWRDMIRAWNADTTGVSGGRVLIPSGGGGGGGAIGPGTPGKLTKWVTASTVGDSLFSDDGSTVSIASGQLTVGGNITSTGAGFFGSGAGLTALNASQLTTGTVAAARLPSFVGGDVTSAAGSAALTINANAVTTPKLVDGAVTTAKLGAGAVTAATIAGGTITNAQISPTAAIAWTKIDKTGATFADFGASAISWAQLPAGAGVWTGTPTITGVVSLRSDLIPDAGSVVNLGRIDRLINRAFVSQIESVAFNVATQTLFGGYSTIAKQAGVLAAAATTGTTAPMDFGQAMTPNDWILIRADSPTSGLPVAEYLQVRALVSGTTYNTIRNLPDSLGTVQPWPKGTPYQVLGHSGDGRIDMLAADGKPRTVYAVQGVTYDAATVRAVMGNLSGYYGYTAGSGPGGADPFGVAFGDISKSWIKVDDTNGVTLGYGGATTVKISPTGASSFEAGITIGAAGSVTAGGVILNNSGLFISPIAAAGGGTYANTNAVRWTTDATFRTAIWRSDDTSGSPVRTWNFEAIYPGATVPVAYTKSLTRVNSAVSGFGAARVDHRVQATGADLQLWTGTDFSNQDAFCWLGSINGPAGGRAILGTGTASAMSGSWVSPPTINCGIRVEAGAVNVIGKLILPASVPHQIGASTVLENIDATTAIFANNLAPSDTWRFLASGGSTMIYLSAGQVTYYDGGTGSAGGAAALVPMCSFQTSFFRIGPTLGFLNDTTAYITNDAVGRMAFYATSALRLVVGGAGVHPGIDNSHPCGASTVRWTAVYAVNGTIQTSDARMKRDVRPTRFGSAFLRALSAVDYNWTNPTVRGDRRYQGFVAQDVARIDPSFGALEVDDFGVTSGLNYSGFLAPLVRGWQEHDDRIAALERRLDA